MARRLSGIEYICISLPQQGQADMAHVWLCCLARVEIYLGVSGVPLSYLVCEASALQ